MIKSICSVINTTPAYSNKKVSFSSNKIENKDYTISKSPHLMGVQPYIPSVKAVVDKSQASYNIFKAKLDSIFYDCTKSDTRNPNNSIGTLVFNDEKFEKGKNRIADQKVKTGFAAKNIINDEELISARIILDKGTPQEGNRALNRVIKAIKNQSLIVKEIRTYGENPQTAYATSDRINNILKQSDELGYPCSKVSQRKNTGYHALHLKCQLEDGFIGTLEITGKEVSKLKDIEDVIHRLSKGYTVDEKFKKVEEAYSQLTKEDKLKLTDYTRCVYLQCRVNEILGIKEPDYMQIDSFGLPKIFDFNNLEKIKNCN